MKRRLFTCLLLTVLLTAAALAEKPRVLTLPFRPAETGVEPRTGLALANLVDNLLAAHPGLRENWFHWNRSKLFPELPQFDSWLAGGPDPESLAKLDYQLLLRGRFYADRVELELHRQEGPVLTGTAILDYPELLGFQKALLELLARGGVALPQADITWKEALSNEVMDLYARGLTLYLFDDFENSGDLHRLAQRARNSYLALNNAAWLDYVMKEYETAYAGFEKALQVHPSGIDTLSGLIAASDKLDRLELQEKWLRRKAQIQREDPDSAVAGAFNRRGNQLFKDKDHEAALLRFRVALKALPDNLVYHTNALSCLRELKRFDDAFALLEQLKQQFSPAELAPAERALVIERADQHYADDKFAEAAEDYRRAELLSQNEAYRLSARSRLVRALAQDGRRQQALEEFEGVESRVAKLEEGESKAVCWLETARALRSLNEHRRATDYYELSIAFLDKNKIDAPGTINEFATNLYLDRRYQRALEMYERVLEYRLKSDHPALAVSYLFTVRTLHRLGRYQQALEYCERGLKAVPEGRMLEARAFLCNEMGITKKSLGDYRGALVATQQAAELFAATQDPVECGRAYNRMGSCARLLGDHGSWLQYSEKALQMGRQAGDPDIQADALAAMGWAYSELRQRRQSLECFEKALELARQHNLHGEAVDNLKNIGWLHFLLDKDPAQALPFFEQGLALARQHQLEEAEANMLASLGVAQQDLKIAEGSKNLEAALALHRKFDNREKVGDILTMLGRGYFLAKDYVKATETLEEALLYAEEQSDRSGQAANLNNLMFCWKARGQKPLAIYYGKQSVNISQELRGYLVELDEELQQGYLKGHEHTYRVLADLLIAEGRLAEAQRVLRLLKEEEFFQFVSRDSSLADDFAEGIQLNPEEEKWKAQAGQVMERLALVGRERSRLLAQEFLSEKEQTRLDQLDAELELAGRVFAEFQERLFQEMGEAGAPRVMQLAETQALMADLAELGSETVVLYTLVGDDKLRQILITSSFQKAYEIEVNQEELYRMVHRMRRAVADPNKEYLKPSQDLYQALLAPLEKDLNTLGAKRLMWSLDGALRYVPIAALHDGEKFLVERYENVVFTPASQARLKDEPRSSDWRVLGVGVSKSVGGFQALPEVVGELEAVADIYPGQVQLDESFTLQAFRNQLRRRYPVVHIASHFNFRPGDESKSYLLLGDGEQLALDQLKRMPAVFAGVDLLTLSACNTATGDGGGVGKEVEGFAVLAQRQGAKAVVATLWPVADQSTRQLMTHFYETKKQPGQTKASALREAQLKLLKGQHPHPYHWAPFILIGNFK